MMGEGYIYITKNCESLLKSSKIQPTSKKKKETRIKSESKKEPMKNTRSNNAYKRQFRLLTFVERYSSINNDTSIRKVFIILLLHT